VNQFTNPQSRAVANSLARASTVAAPKDPALGSQLDEAATGLRRSEGERAQTALTEAGRLFRDAERQEQSASAVEQTLATLEDSRQRIATAGAETTERKQVGFRRSSPEGSAQQGTGPEGTDNGGDQATGQTGGTGDQASNPSGGGQNVPAFGPVNGGGTGPSQPGNDTTGSGGQGAGVGQGGQPTDKASTGQAGGGGGGAGTGAKGPVQGQISGPIKGGGGSTSTEGGAVGTGTGASSQAAGGSGQNAERIYVPGREEQRGGGVVGQASPEFRPEDALSGRVGTGPGGEEQSGAPNAGSVSTIRTPYSEVLGEYTQQATEALNRAYVPPDAKEYVRDYFAELGK